MSTQKSQIRIGDVEREAAVTALGEHFAAGRLDRDEFDERSAQAYAARTVGQIQPLFTDLPAPHPPAVPRQGRRSGSASAGAPATGRPRSRRLPLVPLLMVALVVMMVTGTAWPVFLLAFGLWWMSRSFTGSRGEGGWGVGGGCGGRMSHSHR